MMVVTCSKLKNNFGKYLEIAIKKEDVLIKKYGHIVAKIIPIDNKQNTSTSSEGMNNENIVR